MGSTEQKLAVVLILVLCSVSVTCTQFASTVPPMSKCVVNSVHRKELAERLLQQNRGVNDLGEQVFFGLA